MLGRRIGPYHVIAKLGDGGMGSVWKAIDTTLNRPVALKVLHERLLDTADARVRFLREARAASSLDHPGIAAIYGAGDDGGEFYIAQAFVEGETVGDRIACGALPVPDALRIAAETAEALDHAHQRGVLHRDVSARNIMIATDSHPVLIDFGLALRPDTTRITPSDAVVGTLGYQSPEVLQGSVVDHRSDLYGLGVVLYEMLTGTLPFMLSHPAAMAYALVHETPPAPSMRREGLSPAIDALVMRAIAREPADRYPDGAALARAIKRVIAGDAPEGDAAAVPVREHASPPLPVMMPALKRLAVMPFRDVGISDQAADPVLLAGLSETLCAALGRVPSMQVLTGASETHPDADPATLARALGANLVMVGKARRSNDRLRLSFSIIDPKTSAQLSGDTVEGEMCDLFPLEDALFDAVVNALRMKPERPPGRPRALSPDVHGTLVRARGLLVRSQDLGVLNEAIGLLEGLVAGQGDSPIVHAELAKAYLGKYILTYAAELPRLAERACRRALAHDPHSPEVLVTLGRLDVLTGKYPEAIEALQQAIDMRHDFAEAHQLLSGAYEGLGQWHEAEQSARRAISLRPKNWGSWNRLGSLLFRQGRLKEASEVWRRATQIAPDNAMCRANLANCLVDLGQLEGAVDEFRLATAAGGTPAAYTGLGTALFRLGRRREALDAFRKAVELSPQDARLWGNLADAQRWEDDQRDDSVVTFERAVSLERRHLAVNANDAEAWSQLALWLAKLGRRQEALDAIGRSLELLPEHSRVLTRAVMVHHLAGERRDALDMLKRAMARGCRREEFRSDPELDTLRQDPEAAAILDQASPHV